MGTDEIVQGRDRLLSVAYEALIRTPGVVAVFLAGSLAAGTADPYSDIDLRVVVTPDRHPWFVQHRCDIPQSWPNFLFNEWMPRSQHCVSHFRPFNKIDIFYYSAGVLQPSPWYALPIKILHDPEGVVAGLLARSRGLTFDVGEDEIDFSISKGLAAAHEAVRRARRGELLYAQTLLDEFRQHVMRADDFLFARTPEVPLHAKFDRRGSVEVLAALSRSFCPLDAASIESSVVALAGCYRDQITRLHETFALRRRLGSDLEALDLVAARFAKDG